MATKIECHFQEGFAGETVVLSAGGAELSRLPMRTRPQTGLAGIASVEIAAGRVATVSVPDANLSAARTVAESDRWITVNRRGNALVLESVPACPGYV